MFQRPSGSELEGKGVRGYIPHSQTLTLQLLPRDLDTEELAAGQRKGLDFSLLEREKARIAAPKAPTDEDLESALLEGRASATQHAVHTDTAPAEEARFRPIHQPAAPNVSADAPPEYVFINGKRMRRKKKPAAAASAEPISESTAGARPSFAVDVDDEDADIFGDAGVWEGLSDASDDDESTKASGKGGGETHDTTPSTDAQPTVKRDWFNPTGAAPLAPAPNAEATKAEDAGDDGDDEDEGPQRLEGLQSSALPSDVSRWLLEREQKSAGADAGPPSMQRKRKRSKKGRGEEDNQPAADDEDVSIYDEVNEKTYQSFVRGRLMEDDFIDDDDGSGYVDHGQDEWEHGASGSEHDTEDETEYFERTGRRKPKKGSKHGKRDAAGRRDYVGRMHSAPGVARGPAPRDAAPSKEKEDEFMSSLFGGLQENMSTPARPMASLMLDDREKESPSVVLARKRRHDPVPATLPDLVRGGDSSMSTDASSDPPEPPRDCWLVPAHVADDAAQMWTDGDEDMVHEHAAKKMKSSPLRAECRLQPKEEEHVEDGSAGLPMADSGDGTLSSSLRTEPPKAEPGPATPACTVKQQDPPTNLQSWRSIYDGVANVTSAPDTPRGAAASMTDNAAALGAQVFQADRSVHFYWLDYYEIDGVVHLFGKVFDRATSRYVSASVCVGGIERCIFLQPRARAEVDGHATDVVPGEDELYDEFDSLRSRHGIQSWLGKWVTRKYAFELDDVPAEGEYLKVKYGFDEPQLPMDLSGRTFSRAFGTNTTAFELFVVKRRIMGPCWLRMTNASVNTAAPQTWCKLELSVDDPKEVAPFSDFDAAAPKETPPVTVMSVAARSVVNYKENKREVVAISSRVWRDMSLENATPPEQLPSVSSTVVRPLGPSFPARFEAEAKQGKNKIQALKYERMVLNSFLAQVHLNDPDVIMSYDFAGTHLDILLHRMKELKCEQWSKLGRLRRTRWPLLRQGMNTRLLAGRLVCDLSSETSKGMITSTTWSLSEMCRTYLNTYREDIDPDDVASYFDNTAPTPERLLMFVRHCEVDAFFQMAVASKVQLLALTKQLTNLAGNAWCRTLNGGRAERNEYILLHEFHRKKYICPDKVSAWEKKALVKAKQGEGADAAPAAKREKFKGGLVFEPKRGLWDKYILVMDFNSLYPSIIQEFNIDFTTVDCTGSEGKDLEDVPEPPSSDVAQGILPQLIATLVNRRRQVKSLMKDKSAAPLKLLQWNIKQQALKLTANSMYGCLGFENSRFYARPLAALTTFKGREILTMTRELAESMSLDVIYGDTDSVMINTNCLDYREALRIGTDFKRAVNEKYRLLEIDIDGVFQRMLLLQKKKYAALLVADNGTSTTTEIKGLDMKRREYCNLSKSVSSYVLDCILSGEATEVVVEKIHDHLQQVAADVRAGKVPLDDLVIYKRLGKRPQDYPDAQNQPHVQVALRMLAKSESARNGDVIPYVFCVGAATGESKATQAERAFHPDDVRRHHDDPAYAIDFKHYLSLQVLLPVERIAENIEGTDRSRLAACLGLDSRAYATAAQDDTCSGREFTTFESQIPSTVRYAHCNALQVCCRACKETHTFSGLSALQEHAPHPVLTAEHGFRCPSCGASPSAASLAVQLELAIRRRIARYYQGVSTCSEPTCGAVTNAAGVYAGRCLVQGCRGRMALQYSDKDLYTQLCFYEYLFDADRALAEVGDGKGRAYVEATLKTHADTLAALRSVAQQYLGRNGRRYVALDKLFAFMRT
ncbi:DNA-directed DNA polymerase [Malassezia sp. CBS 17886]|nr:DNA-directed DNA polymerase [Malassezia sp. CBS 17886]